MSPNTPSTTRNVVTATQPISKRERLVRGARQVIYEQGVERTSLVEVARAAGVPVGNIYYYFKTKDELVAAAVASHTSDRHELIEQLEELRTPKERLHGLLDALADVANSVAEYGCPLGTLSAELDKRNGTQISEEGQQLLVPMIDWAEQQFANLGRIDARQLAVTLIAGYEGAALLTHSLRDPTLLLNQTERLHLWIDEVTLSPAP